MTYSKTFSNSDEDFTSEKIILTTKIWGLINYYHSDVGKANVNWDKVFVDNYEEWIKASDKKTFNIFLGNLVSNIRFDTTTPDKQFVEFIFSNQVTKLSSFKKVSLNEYYPYTPNFSWLNKSMIEDDIRNGLMNLLIDYKPFKRKSIKKTGKFLINHLEDYNSLKGDPNALFTLGIISFWNKIYYYFPYKDLMDKPWNDVLADHTPNIKGMENETSYINCLKSMAANLNDSHVKVIDRDYEKWYYGLNNWATFPVALAIVNNKAYIKYVADSLKYTSLKQGDQVTHINSIPITQYSNNLKKLISASNVESEDHLLSFRLLPIINHPVLGDSIVTITVQNKEYQLSRGIISGKDLLRKTDYLSARRNPLTKDIISYTGYINLININRKKDIRLAFRQFKDKKRIILDLRGYPKNVLIYLAKYLSTKTKQVASFYYPYYNYPGVFKDYEKNLKYFVVNTIDYIFLALSPSKGKIFPSFTHPYKGQIIVLINEKGISYSETIGIIIKAYRPNTVFIGRPSNGANGDVVDFPLPFNVDIYMTGLHWHFPDGTDLQRKGITPDIYVNKTFDEAVMGEDVILERAIEYTTIKH